MKRSFALAFLAGVAALSTGCIIVEDDPVQPGDYLDAQFSLTWIVQVAGSSEPYDCHYSGANTVIVESTNVQTGDVYLDLWDCGDEAGVTQLVVAGDYDVQVSLHYCDAEGNCLGAMVGESAGRFEVYEDGVYDLGHFVLLVD